MISLQLPGLEEFIEQKIKQSILDLKTPGQANYSIRQAAELKGAPKNTINTHEYLQPWAGFSYREGIKKYWPAPAVEEWLEIFDHNRMEYFRKLLNHENREIADGVRMQLNRLAGSGKLPEKYLALLTEKEKG